MTAPPAGNRRMRLPGTARLGRRGEFRRVFDRGRKAVGRHLVLYLLPNGTPECRLGITVSRRFGPAVQRNRARRQVREAFRQVRGRWSGGYDLVVLPRRAAFPARLPELMTELEALVGRAATRRTGRRRAAPTARERTRQARGGTR